jgi:hypothetical protein
MIHENNISFPLNKWEAFFPIWQEAKRKDVEVLAC